MLLEANGIHPLRAWPKQFERSQVHPATSFAAVLDLLANYDVYPPLTTAVIYGLRGLPNPIAAPRLVFLLLGVLLVVLVHDYARAVKGSGMALMAAAYVAASPLLAVTSQQLKWYAVAPFLATLAGLLLLRVTSVPTAGLRSWMAYVGAMALLFHTHYFCLWAAAAHALYVVTQSRHQLPAFLRACGAIAALCAPWYLLALPRQLDFMRWYFENLGARPHDSWYQPLTIVTTLASTTYSLLAAAGLQPSFLRVRYMLPLVVILLVCTYRCATAANQGVRRLGRLALITLAVALAAQTACAIDVKSTIPLTFGYFSTWAPLFMMCALFGAQELGRPWARHGATGILLGLTIVNLVQHRYPAKIAEAASLGDLAGVTRVLVDQPRGTIVAFRRDRDAKVTNLFYRGEMTQLIADRDGTVRPPPSAVRIIFVSRVGDPPSPQLPGWTSPRLLPSAARTARLEVMERAPVP